MDAKGFPRPSRRPLRGLLRMRFREGARDCLTLRRARSARLEGVIGHDDDPGGAARSMLRDAALRPLLSMRVRVVQAAR